MRSFEFIMAGMLTAVALSPAAVGDVVFDPIGDIATGNANLDIAEVSITDNGTDVFIGLTVAALDADWGKYMLFLDFDNAAGSGDNDNPWGRNVSGLGGTDVFAGAWLDGGGGVDVQEYVTGGGWQSASGTIWASLEVDWAASTITWTFHNAVTGSMADGYTGFELEVATTGGNWGDPAIDLLGDEGVQPGWGGGSHSEDQYWYEFSTVPAPGALTMLALAGCMSRRRR